MDPRAPKYFPSLFHLATLGIFDGVYRSFKMFGFFEFVVNQGL